ncbi:hypothetical protein AVEN_171971-1 [Araneus ventricosus]|uniref:Uncharacterized protein n=1 Tax=Araneus ventricosus TaxID=182803 RepID=A0A4Y2T7N6_ARAVE|nr:hypothetical protein AVEN_55954-1 [Araneus ventricosus]GBN96637.1 hypothetical protein AVEN_171971-1 [Araneus ventricosus]
MLAFLNSELGSWEAGELSAVEIAVTVIISESLSVLLDLEVLLLLLLVICCLFVLLVGTGANLTILRANVAQKLKNQLIYTTLNICLTTTNGEKAGIRGKLNASIECGSRKYQHRVYVAYITEPCILCLKFLKNLNLTTDLEQNYMRTGGEEIPLLSASEQHRKGTSHGYADLSRRTCIESREHY